MNRKLLEILACPECKAPLDYFPEPARLVCRAERIAYPVRDGIPVLLQDEGESLSSEQLEGLEKARKESGL